jgi:hypothetical protein
VFAGHGPDNHAAADNFIEDFEKQTYQRICVGFNAMQLCNFWLSSDSWKVETRYVCDEREVRAVAQ